MPGRQTCSIVVANVAVDERAVARARWQPVGAPGTHDIFNPILNLPGFPP